jgi:hypothetical protein
MIKPFFFLDPSLAYPPGIYKSGEKETPSSHSFIQVEVL